MHLRQLQDDQQHCMRAAAEALGEPVRAVALDEAVEEALLKWLRREALVGLDGGPAVVRFVDERRGHRLEVGGNGSKKQVSVGGDLLWRHQVFFIGVIPVESASANPCSLNK